MKLHHPINGLPTHYVAIGASAGGLEAIESFVSELPVDSGAAFIIIQHLSPDYKSLMAELLSKKTSLPVHQAEDGSVVLANNIYLIPPKKTLTIFHGKLLLSNQDRHKLNLPIDIFFRSLAEDQGEKSIAIVLSGTGSDGTRGIRAIKEVEGLVLVQDDESAKFDGMPRSAVGTGLADYILPPELMPQQLVSYIKNPYVASDDRSEAIFSEQDSMTRIYALLRKHSGIDFTYYKPATVVRRIERRMTINQTHAVADYVKYLESHNAEVTILFRELLIGVTNFFRDEEAFEILSKTYIPEILEKVSDREIRVWVAGCSTGEEAYSIAILLREAMENIGVTRDVKIFATDLDQTAIETASEGRYPAGIVTDVPPKLLSKYFIRHDDSFQIVRNIRQMVVFAQHNLIKDPPFTNIDLVTCRNLLIYLQPVLQRKALELFNFSLNQDAIMFLGSSESIGDLNDYFIPLQSKWRLYRSQGKRKITGLNLAPASVDETRSLHERLPINRIAARMRHDDERILDRYLQAFSEDYVLFSMVVNTELDVVHAIGDTANFLRVQPGMITSDASKMIHEDLAVAFTTGVRKVLKKNEPLTFSKIRLAVDDAEKVVQMRIKPLPSKKGQPTIVGVFINEMRNRDSLDEQEQEGETFDVSQEAEDRIQDLEQELQFTRENLQATVEELETSNEELQATNEELLASNEELQSTNEELQSVNEELYTVNAEYQSKITELTELTNDLNNLFSSTSIGTLFLDEELDVRRFSTKATELLNLIDSDIGRPLSHISHSMEDVDLLEISRQVLGNNKMIEKEVKLDSGKYYMIRGIPYRIASEVYSGVVLIFIDISKQKIAENELKLSQQRYLLAQEQAKIGTWDWDLKSNKMYWSNNLPALIGSDKESFGRTYQDLIDLIYPDDQELVDDVIKGAIQKGQSYKVDHRVEFSKNNLRWMQEKGKLYFDMKGEPERLIGTIQDITGLKNIEQEFSNLKNTAPSVLVVDDDPLFIQAFKSIFDNYSKEILVVPAKNGLEGLVMAGRYNPVLIVSDLIMPQLNGFEMLRTMDEDPALRDVPKIVTTALSKDDVDRQGGLPENVTIIRKPFDLDDVALCFLDKLDEQIKL